MSHSGFPENVLRAQLESDVGEAEESWLGLPGGSYSSFWHRGVERAWETVGSTAGDADPHTCGQFRLTASSQPLGETILTGLVESELLSEPGKMHASKSIALITVRAASFKIGCARCSETLPQ